MPLSMHAIAMPTFLHMRGALTRIIDKASAHCAAKKIDPAVLLPTRLYPDMFALARQCSGFDIRYTFPVGPQ